MEEYSRPAALAPLGWPNAAKGAAGHRTASTGHSSLLEIALTTQVCYNAALLGMQFVSRQFIQCGKCTHAHFAEYLPVHQQRRG